MGNLLDLGEEGDAQTEIQYLESHARQLYTSARRANSDPFSMEYPPNADLRKKNPPLIAYTDLFGSHRQGSGSYAEFSLSNSGIILAFFRKVYMAKKLTDPLRSALTEYRDTPKTCDGKLIPLGAARRIIQYDDKLRYGRRASRNRSAEVENFPALSPYGG